MKIVRVLCLVLVSLLALSPFGAVFAQVGQQYALKFTPSDGLYNMIAVAGQNRDFRANLENLGEAAVDKIAFSGEVPEGWAIKFDPPRLATLAAYGSETVYVNITVPEKAGAGDYMFSFSAKGDQASTEKIEVRVTVKEVVREETIEIRAVHPKIEAIAGADFDFGIEFKYAGAQLLESTRSFDLVTKAPPGWEVYMTPQYEKDKRISAIDLKSSGFTYGDQIRLVATAPFWPLPKPGEYKITVEADSGDLKSSVLELGAVITASYQLLLAPAGERYDTTTTAGKDGYFSLKVGNLGTAPIDKVNFSSEKPEGWTIEFKPDKVESLEALTTQTVDITIKTTPETIAGDYMISIRASGAQATSDKLDIRVTVKTPTVWGWVGVFIIAMVVIGLVFTFMRFSRR
jgi:uncharacterized membrane protein